MHKITDHLDNPAKGTKGCLAYDSTTWSASGATGWYRHYSTPAFFWSTTHSEHNSIRPVSRPGTKRKDRWRRQRRRAAADQCSSALEFEKELQYDGLMKSNVKETYVLQLTAALMRGRGRSNLLRLHAQLGGVDARVLVDSGASHDFVDEKFALQHVHCFELEEIGPVQVTLGDNKEWMANAKLMHADIRSGGYNETRTFIVLPSLAEEVILGHGWLTQHEPRISWKKSKVEVMQSGQWQQLLTMHDLELMLDDIQSSLHAMHLRLAGVTMDQGHENTAERKLLEQQFPDLFETEALQELPPHRPDFDFEIEYHNTISLPKPRWRRHDPVRMAKLKVELDRLKQIGLVRPSKSPVGAPMFLAVDHNNQKERVVFDYRLENGVTIKRAMQTPHVDDLLAKLAKAKWFTKIDLKSRRLT